MKKRVFYLDFIRALSVLFIIIFHFNCSIGGHGIYQNSTHVPIIFYEYKNGNLGQIGVSLFFIISGAGLMLTNQYELKVKKYIKRRFLAIFPMFYLAYFVVTLYYFFRYGSLNPFGVQRGKWSFILTIIGMDGYLSPMIPNYYIIGEWFLGCIILLYILFPLLRLLLLKMRPWASMLAVLGLYIVTVNIYSSDLYPIEYFVLVRILEFFFGMLTVYCISEVKGRYLFVSVLIIVILQIWYIPILQSYKTTIMGISLFLALAYLGQHIPERYQKAFFLISKYSYPVYLLHHVIIEQICCRFENAHLSLTELYFLLIGCLIFIVFITWLFIKIYNLIENLVIDFR